MADVNGTYILDKNENYDALLKTIGVPDAYIDKLVAAKPKLEVDLSGNILTVTTVAKTKTFVNTITLGKPSKVEVPGLEYEINVTFSGKKAQGTFAIEDRKGNVTLDITDDGFIQTTVFEGVTSKRYYKKQ